MTTENDEDRAFLRALSEVFRQHPDVGKRFTVVSRDRLTQLLATAPTPSAEVAQFSVGNFGEEHHPLPEGTEGCWGWGPDPFTGEWGCQVVWLTE